MSFPSCIKIPAAKNNIAPEFSNHDDFFEEPVSYAELIAIANSVFGQGKWSHSVTSQTIDFVECVMGKYYIGCAAFVRVQRADTFHEDMGYSNAESTEKGSAIYSARLSSINLALKKALLCFGGEIALRIKKMELKTPKAGQEISKLREEKGSEVTGKSQKAAGSCIKEAKSTNGIMAPLEEPSKMKLNGKPLQSASTPRGNKSPRPNDPEDEFIPTGSDLQKILADEFQESSKRPVEESDATTHKDGPPTAMTTEEMRLERKRKQKQKQEEFKRLMKEQLMKSEDKPNPRF